MINFLKKARRDLSIDAFNHAMSVYGSNKDPMLARSLFLDLLNTGPNIAEILICLTACEAILDPESKRIDQWIARAREAGAEPARLLQAQYNIAMRREAFELASGFVRELVQLDPSPANLEMLACVLCRTNPVEGESVAKRLSESHPRHPGGYFGLAAAAEKRDDRLEYVRQMQKAEACDPTRSDIQYSLGQALCSNQNYPEAARHYQNALLLDYEPVTEVLAGLAICALRGDGDVKLAKRFCKRALKVDPNHEECKRIFDECINKK